MKLSDYLAFITAAALLTGCSDKEAPKVEQPAKGPAITGPVTTTTVKPTTVTPAPPPPVEPAKTQVQLFPPTTTTTTPAKTTEPVTSAKPVEPTVSTKPATSPKPAAPAPARVLAKVVMVKSEDKFVILEFNANEVPAPGSQLTLYRGKDRVASVKVTEPMRPPFITADILDGKPERGDEVR